MAYVKYLRFICFASLISLAWSSEELTIDGSSAPAKAVSVNNAIIELQKRKSNGDSIANTVLSTMPYTQFREKEAAILEYNRKLKEQVKIRDATQGIALPAGMYVGGTPSKILKQFATRHMELEEQNRELQAQLETEQKAREEASYKAAAVSPLTKKLNLATQTSTRLGQKLQKLSEAEVKWQEKERELEEQLRLIKNQMGGDTLDGILADLEPSSFESKLATSTLSALELELASYHRKIEDINKRIEKYASVRTDYEQVKKLFDEAITHIVTERTEKEERIGKRPPKTIVIVHRFIPGIIQEEDDIVASSPIKIVLQLMREASDIANRYRTVLFEGEEKEIKDGDKVTYKKTDGPKEQMEKASPEQRVALLESLFLNTYVEIPSNEMSAIGNLDHLELSLDLTLNLEASIRSTKKLGLYQDSEFKTIDETIAAAIRNLRAKIKEQDMIVFNEYMSILEAEKKSLEAISDFSNLPMTIHLLRNPMIIFMLQKPSENIKMPPFNSIIRISEEVKYLSANQKKALFASLYFIVLNFEEQSSEYLRLSLLSKTPIQQDDLYPFIKQVKDAVKIGAEPEIFSPIAMTKNDLRIFTQKANKLISREIYEEAITNRFANTLDNLKRKFNGISKEGISLYLQNQDLDPTETCLAQEILTWYDLVQVGQVPSDLDTIASQGQAMSALSKILDEDKTSLLVKLLSSSNASNEEEKSDAIANASADKAKAVTVAGSLGVKKLGQSLDVDPREILARGDNQDSCTWAQKRLGERKQNTTSANTSNIPSGPDPLAALKAKKKNKKEGSQISTNVATSSSLPIPPARTNLLAGIQAKRKDTGADDSTTTGKLPARPAFSLGAVSEETAETLEQDLVLLEATLNVKKASGEVNEAKYEEYKELITAARASIETAIPTAKMKINKLKKLLPASKPNANSNGNSSTTAAPPLPKPNLLSAIVRPAPMLAVVSADSLEQDLVQLESQLKAKKDGMTEEEYEGYKTRIQAARNNIETALPTAQMKIKSLKRDLK